MSETSNQISRTTGKQSFWLHSLPIHLVLLLTSILPNLGIFTSIRGLLISPWLGVSGSRLQIAKGLVLNRPERVHVGDDVYFAHNVWINATGGLRIGSGVSIGPMCVIATVDHKPKAGLVGKAGVASPIVIGKGAWLGSHVVITRGVTIGDDAIVGAGSVVTEDVPPKTLVAGVPARHIRSLHNE